MQQKPYIENRLINLSGVLPILGNDFSISCHSALIHIGMIPIPSVENNFDYLVVSFRAVQDGYTAFPMGILPKVAHPMFYTQTQYHNMKAPLLWSGKAHFSDYKMALDSLAQVYWPSVSMRSFRNLNKVASEIYQTFSNRPYAHLVEYAGHELLG